MLRNWPDPNLELFTLFRLPLKGKPSFTKLDEFWDILRGGRVKFWSINSGQARPSWGYLGIFCVYLRCILSVCWGYLGYILGISWVYLGDILGISWVYLGYILGISREYLGDIWLVTAGCLMDPAYHHQYIRTAATHMHGLSAEGAKADVKKATARPSSPLQ